jgi:hypothetical protein
MRSPSSLCVYDYPPLPKLLNAWTSLYETWYVYHGTWARLYVWALLGNDSVKMLRLQQIHAQQ